VVFHGFFHGDVHAGNLMLLDNEDLGFLDFGIVGRFNDHQRYLVTDYIIAFATSDFRKLADVICDMGGVPNGIDRDEFGKDLAETYKPLLSLSFGEVNYADMIPRINRVASKHRMTMPKEFVLITKQLLYFDRYAKLLAPNLNIFTDPRLIMSMITDIQKVRSEQAAAQA
jgi:predicted unusual protein kinase regulating ubiquinone biosynthesis (AarF/ABC1/UbiB family)